MDIQDSCGTLLKQIHDALEKQANNSLRADGLTMAQVGVLLMLDRAEHRQMPLKELEKALHVAQSTAAGIVSRLEQKGLVESFGDAEDRRVKVVRLSGRSRLLPDGGRPDGRGGETAALVSDRGRAGHFYTAAAQGPGLLAVMSAESPQSGRFAPHSRAMLPTSAEPGVCRQRSAIAAICLPI